MDKLINKRRLSIMLIFCFCAIAFANISAFAAQEEPEQPEISLDPPIVEAEEQGPSAEIIEERNHATISLSGDNVATENTTVVYTVSVANIEKFATATIWIEVDGSFVEGNGFEGLNGFQVLDDINWENNDGDIWRARITLANLGDRETSVVPIDILSVSLNTRDKCGRSEIKIIEAKLCDYNESDQEVYIDCDLVNNLIELEIAQYFSPYDVNRDDVVDQRDLTLAQLYYTVGESDSDWDIAKCADVNSDVAVDAADFVLIIGNIVW